MEHSYTPPLSVTPPFVLFSLVLFEIGAQANLLGWLGTHCVAWAALL